MGIFKRNTSAIAANLLPWLCILLDGAYLSSSFPPQNANHTEWRGMSESLDFLDEH
jgi:hypothetical protein